MFFGVYDWVGQEEAAMRTPMHWRTERGRHFQAHPLHATFEQVWALAVIRTNHGSEAFGVSVRATMR